MGIDNDAVLVYGWTFQWEDISDNVAHFLKGEELKKEGGEQEGKEEKQENSENSEDSDDNAGDCYSVSERFEERLMEEHGLDFGSASPYYDCEFRERVFYVNLLGGKGSNRDFTQHVRETMQKDFEVPAALQWLLKSSPKLYILPHVW